MDLKHELNYTRTGLVVRGREDIGGDVVISPVVELDGKGYPVTEIGDDAFWRCFSLTRVVIPNSIKEIGMGAFASCNGLIEVSYSGTYDEWLRVKGNERVPLDVPVKCADGKTANIKSWGRKHFSSNPSEEYYYVGWLVDGQPTGEGTYYRESMDNNGRPVELERERELTEEEWREIN